MNPRALVLEFPGSNGHRDLAQAFARAGFDVTLHPSSEHLPGGVHLVGLPGGFSYGDYWRAGALARAETAVRDLANHRDHGGLVFGVCNGFQILTAAGLLEGALAPNDPSGFRHAWVEVELSRAGTSAFTFGLAEGSRFRMPTANGEGRYAHVDGARGASSRCVLRYVENPNGSLADVAAIGDPTGRVFGVMPHPERASHPQLGSEDGLAFFRAARRHLDEAIP